MAYNVAQALKDGLSEEEIATHLAETRKYRLDEAVKAGVTHRQIINFLAPQKPIGQKPTLPVVPSTPRPRELFDPASETPVTPPGGIVEEAYRKGWERIEKPAQVPILPPGVGGVDVMRHRPSPVTAEVDLTEIPKELTPSHEPFRPTLGVPPAEPSKDFGLRPDGTPKGTGFLGVLKRPDGKVSSEISIGVNIDGKEVEIPTLIPTLAQDEINYLLSGGEPTDAIIGKAAEHAKSRMAKGLSPFAQEGEQPIPSDAERAEQVSLAERAKATAPSIGTLKDVTEPKPIIQRGLLELLGIVPVGRRPIFGKEGLGKEEIVRSQNIVSMANETNLPPSFVEENYDAITQKLGMRGVPTYKEMIQMLISAGIGRGIITAPFRTAMGLGTFLGVKELESLATQIGKGEVPQPLQGRELKEFLGPLDSRQNLIIDAMEFVVPGFLGAQIMLKTKGKLSKKLSDKIIDDAWDTYVEKQSKNLLEYKGKPSGDVQKLGQPLRPLTPSPPTPEPIGSTIPAPGQPPVTAKPPVVSPAPQPIPPIMGMGQEMEVSPPPVIVKPPPAAKAQEIVGATIPTGTAPITPTKVEEKLAPTPVEVPTQPIPQMMGMGQPGVAPVPTPPVTEEFPILAEKEAIGPFPAPEVTPQAHPAVQELPKLIQPAETLPEEGPIIAYHGTRDAITAFRPLSHFGTEKASEDALMSVKGKGKATKVKAELDIKNPLEVNDTSGTGREEVVSWAWDAVDQGILTEDQSNVIENLFFENQDKGTEAFINALREKGYDGLRYVNKTEDPGSVSWVTFSPDQVKTIPLVSEEELEKPLVPVIPPSEWQKDPILVADADAVVNRINNEYPDAELLPEDLEYQAVQEFEDQGMHMWNVNKPGHPKNESAVYGPIFKLSPEKAEAAPQPISEEEAKPGPLRPEAAGIEPIKKKAKPLNIPEGWTTAVQPTWRRTPGWQAEVDWKDKRIVFETEADSKNVDIVNHEIGHIQLDDKLGDVLKLSDSPLLQTYAKIVGEEKDTHVNFIREHLAMDYGEYLTNPEKAKPELKALFEEYFPKEGIGPIPPTAQDLELMPEEYPKIDKVAMMQDGKVYTDSVHGEIVVNNNLDPERAIRGYTTKGGEFVPAEKVEGIAPEAKVEEVRELGGFQKFMDKLGYRLASEQKGQTILDDMAEREISPQSVNSLFWEKTYPKLNDEQRGFVHKYIQSLTSMRPGSTLGTDAAGKAVIAKDWMDIGKDLDLGNKAEFLEGTERGYVAIIRAANEKLAKPEAKVEVTPSEKVPALTQMREKGVPESFPEVPFQVDDKLTMHSPYSGEDTIVNYRGPMPDGKAMVWTGKTQISVPEEWLSRLAPEVQKGEVATKPSGPRDYAKPGDYVQFKTDGPEYYITGETNKNLELIDTKGQKQSIPRDTPLIKVDKSPEVHKAEVTPTLSESSAKKLLSLPYEQRVSPSGDQNAKFRQQILKELTGQDLPKNKSGAGRVREELTRAAGIDTTGKAPVEIDREIHDWLRGIAGVEKRAEVSPIALTLPPGYQVVPAVSKKTKKVTVGDRAKKFYQPGNIVYVDYWKQYDKILKVKGTAGEGDWSVQVQQVDKEGNATPDSEPRWHTTLPSKGDRIEKLVPPAETVEPPLPSKPIEEIATTPPGFKAEEPKPEPKKIEPVVEEVPTEPSVETKPLKWADLPEGVRENIPEELTDLRTEPYFGTQVIKGEKPAQYNPDKLITHIYDAKTGQELHDWELGKIRSKVEDEKVYETHKAEIAQLPDVEGKKVEPVKERPVQTQKDQKKYLIDAIDEAIKQAPEKGVEPVLLKIPDTNRSKPIMEKTPHVIIEVPGDGTFRVINSKKALKGFKEAAEKRFPTKIEPINIPGLTMPSGKPSGRRISPKEDAGYEYITEYSPKRVGEADYATTLHALVGEGWFTNGEYAVKGSPPETFGKKAPKGKEPLTKKAIDQVIPSLKGMLPVTHVAEFHIMGSPANSGIAINDKNFTYFNPTLMDVIRKSHPDATLYIKGETTPIAFVKDKGVVGLLMPFRADSNPPGLVEEYFADQGIKVPWEVETPKEEVKVEAPSPVEEPTKPVEPSTETKETTTETSSEAKTDYDSLFKRFKNQTPNQAIDYFEVEGHKVFKVEDVELPKGMGGTGLGFTNDAEGNIYLRKDLNRQGFEKALGHELRHHREKGWEETVNLKEMIEPSPETKAGIPEIEVKDPWEMKPEEFPAWEDTRVKRTSPTESPKGFSEEEMWAASLKNRNLETTPPPHNKFPVGQWAKDSAGELMQLREYDINDPILEFPEGKPKNQTVDKYAQWIREGNESPPMDAVETQGGKVRVNEGHHRLAAIEKAGGDKVKIWVSVSREQEGHLRGVKPENAEILKQPPEGAIEEVAPQKTEAEPSPESTGKAQEGKPPIERKGEMSEGKKPWEVSSDEYVAHKNIPESAEIFHKTAQSRKALQQHERAVKQALLTGDLTPGEYKRLHEKDYGKLEEFAPELEKQVEEAPKKINAKTLTKEIKSEPDYVYHATNEERLSEIADTGKLRTHKPGEFTDQDVWPDGSTKKRAYFSDKADIVWQFAPEEGRPVVIRTKGKGLLKESTGDVYSNKPISVDTLEYLGEDDNWHPVSGLKTSGKVASESPKPELSANVEKGGVGEKPKVGDAFTRPDGTPVRITKVNSDGTFDVVNGSTRMYLQELSELKPVTEEQFIESTKEQVAELRKESTRLRQEASDYNKSVEGRATERKGKVQTFPARIGKGGVDIQPWTENAESLHHRKLIDSARKVSGEADLLAQSIAPKVTEPKPVVVNMRTVKMEQVPGAANIRRITNIDQSVLDNLGWDSVEFEPGEPQKVFAISGGNRIPLFDGDVSSELIPFLKKSLNLQPSAKGKEGVAINNAFKKWKESLKTKGEGGKMLYAAIPLVLPFLMNDDEKKRKGVKDQRREYPQPSYLPPGLGR